MIDIGSKVIVNSDSKLHAGKRGMLEGYVGNMCIIKSKDAEGFMSSVFISVNSKHIKQV